MTDLKLVEAAQSKPPILRTESTVSFLFPPQGAWRSPKKENREKLFEPLAIFELTFVGEDKIFAERNLKIIGPTPLPPQK